MRLWSLHPSQLDRAALIAGWREALLAQAVLAGKTKGYTKHPQLERFASEPEPLAIIGAYLSGLHVEATLRGYRFDQSRILMPLNPGSGSVAAANLGTVAGLLTVTTGQLEFEWQHLTAKVRVRALEHAALLARQTPLAHPLFNVIPGPIEPWERGVTSQH